MAQKTSGQYDFVDAWLGNNQNLNQQLDRIVCLIDWKPFEEKLSQIYSSKVGKRSYPTLLLFKSLLLQAWYDLSDYALKAALDDRLSFRRFTGLSVSEKSPDHSVFSRFRDQLIKHSLHENLFNELSRQLDEQGLIMKKGTLIDATVLNASSKKPNQNKDGSAGKSPKEPEAGWTKKGGQYLFGYKGHIGVDQESELIRKIFMTPAHVHDGEVFCHVLSGDESWAFADKAYDSSKNHQILQEKNKSNGILMKGTVKRRLGETEKACNKILSKLRYSVERIFGTLKRSYRYRRSHYLGLKKSFLQLTMMSMAYNLRRMAKLCL